MSSILSIAARTGDALRATLWFIEGVYSDWIEPPFRLLYRLGALMVMLVAILIRVVLFIPMMFAVAVVLLLGSAASVIIVFSFGKAFGFW
ncbi:hypothetical protein [Asticcacaulis sp. W401b]|uniref:hypothetical protein n=1 Tax=Asticcacaulis sp. W401b TaxID=3388666 RepID=UPI003971100B